MLKDSLLDLLRRTSSDLPPDIREALRRGREKETPGSRALLALTTIEENNQVAADESAPSVRIRA